MIRRQVIRIEPTLTTVPPDLCESSARDRGGAPSSPRPISVRDADRASRPFS